MRGKGRKEVFSAKHLKEEKHVKQVKLFLDSQFFLRFLRWYVRHVSSNISLVSISLYLSYLSCLSYEKNS